MTTHLQEIFTSTETPRELTSKLISAGFSEGKKFGFETDGAFVSINPVRSDGPGAETPHDCGIVLELYRPLRQLPEDHPVRKFFRSLNEPCAHGMGDIPQYRIQEYLA